MGEAKLLTFDDLITGLLEEQRWEEAHPDLRDYFALRAKLLCSLFDCDLETADGTDGVHLGRSRVCRDRDLFLPKVDREDRRHARNLLSRCIKLANHSATPWYCWLEGRPPLIERQIRDRFAQTIEEKAQELNRVYGQIIRELLEHLFGPVGDRTFPAERLIEMGLPAEPPDINYYD